MRSTSSKSYALYILAFLFFLTIVPSSLATDRNCKQIYGGGEICDEAESVTITPSPETPLSQQSYIPLKQTPATGAESLSFVGLTASGITGLVIIGKVSKNLTRTRDN